MLSDAEVCECGKIATEVHLGTDRWACCGTCGVRWWTGRGADARPQDGAAVVAYLQRFRARRPIDASKLDDVRRALGLTS
jgi:hypothetical protein